MYKTPFTQSILYIIRFYAFEVGNYCFGFSEFFLPICHAMIVFGQQYVTYTYCCVRLIYYFFAHKNSGTCLASSSSSLIMKIWNLQLSFFPQTT